MDVQTVTVIIAGISVIIGVINSILSSRRAEKNDEQTLETRQAQLYMQIYNRWNSRDLVNAYVNTRYVYQWKDYDDFIAKYHPPVNPEASTNFTMMAYFFEGLGVLVKKGLIDISLVEDLLSQRVIWYWENIAAPNVEKVRELTDDPTQYDHIEYLYHELKHRQRLTTRPEIS
jgi:hypothetical protein